MPLSLAGSGAGGLTLSALSRAPAVALCVLLWLDVREIASSLRDQAETLGRLASCCRCEDPGGDLAAVP